MEDIKRTARRYMLQAVTLVLSLGFVGTLLCYALSWEMSPYGYALLVSVAFYTVVACTVGTIWKVIALKYNDMLTSFYMATSGLRMVLALFSLTAIYVVVGRQQISVYAVVFMIFYAVTIGHHSFFFARVTNKQG